MKLWERGVSATWFSEPFPLKAGNAGFGACAHMQITLLCSKAWVIGRCQSTNFGMHPCLFLQNQRWAGAIERASLTEQSLLSLQTERSKLVLCITLVHADPLPFSPFRGSYCVAQAGFKTSVPSLNLPCLLPFSASSSESGDYRCVPSVPLFVLYSCEWEIC